MTQALDAEAAAAAVAAFPSSSSPTAAHTEASFALQASIDALTPSDGLQVTDDILRQLMETRGTRDGRVVQEMLSMAPYNVNASYEVVQRRVMKLLDEESSAIIVHTFPDNAVNTPEDDEKEKTREINAEGDTGKVENQVGKEKETAEDQVHEKAARDLDMLADTVRSIVTDVEEAETTLVDGGDDAIETQSNVVGDVEVEVETQSADGKSGADKPSMDRNFTDVVQLDKVGMAQTAQDTTDAVIAVGLPSSDPREVCNGAPATEGNATKQPVTNEGKSGHKPKRLKRAEYSVETRALCVRRHQTEGASYATISKELGIPHDSVRAIIRKAKRTGSVVSAPRSGRPRKTSGIVDKVILEAVRSNKQCSAKSIQEELLRVYGVKLSPETVRRRVLEHTKQRIQANSNGTSELEDKSAATSTVAAEAPATSSQDHLVNLDTSLSDAGSFQELLNGEKQSRAGSELEISSSTTRRPIVEVTPSVASSPTNDMALDPEEVPDLPNKERSTSKRKKRAEYSIEKREQCVSLHAQGQGYRRIGKALNMPHTTVRAIVEKAQRTGTVLPAKRSGRPRKTDAIVDKVILQAVKANERSSARIIKEQLQAVYGVRVSCETIRRRVKDHSRQCMSTSASAATPDMLPHPVADAALSQEEASQAGATMSRSPSMPGATLMTFVENGMHI